MPDSSYRPPAHQGSSIAYFSAMPGSSYRPPAIQGSSSGYSGHQGQNSGQQSMHQSSDCPEVGGQAGRGHPRGGGQVGGGQPAIVQPGGGHPAGAPARFYAFLSRLDAVASEVVITDIISVCGRDASVLFDPWYTYSYVSSLFAHFLDIPRESLGTPVYVSTHMGDSMVVDRIYRSCVVTFCGYETRADLLLLDMTDFEVILGMDWLSPYHAILDFHVKTVTLTTPKFLSLEWKGSSVKARQFDDLHLASLREMVLQGGAKEVSIGEDGVLQLQGRLCIPDVNGLRERIL
ncbi:uncharacterized protein [Nicotiana tomentosiformis]|uniref:uncharacterized protein n=1 Tax=Nicotiana tomentosiformis TaxID=4098 RepID=UPI00388C8C78